MCACSPPLAQMRETYGKLMYLLQDSCEDQIIELLEFKQVHALLAAQTPLPAPLLGLPPATTWLLCVHRGYACVHRQGSFADQLIARTAASHGCVTPPLLPLAGAFDRCAPCTRFLRNAALWRCWTTPSWRRPRGRSWRATASRGTRCSAASRCVCVRWVGLCGVWVGWVALHTVASLRAGQTAGGVGPCLGLHRYASTAPPSPAATI